MPPGTAAGQHKMDLMPWSQHTAAKGLPAMSATRQVLLVFPEPTSCLLGPGLNDSTQVWVHLHWNFFLLFCNYAWAVSRLSLVLQFVSSSAGGQIPS